MRALRTLFLRVSGLFGKARRDALLKLGGIEPVKEKYEIAAVHSSKHLPRIFDTACAGSSAIA